MHIQELLAMTDLAERNKCLQRSFAPDTTDLEVDGKEVATVVVLLNLTVKRDRIANVCDEQHARQLLLDERHLADCLHAVRWLHSHNLKYPDCRVSEQRLIIDSPAPIPGVITSAGLPMRLGWANNSAKINAAKLFGSSFQHQGSTTNLALQLVTGKPVWQAALAQLGLPLEQFATWVRLLAQHLAVARVPVVVSQYSKQVRLPYQGGYCAITPVVSHALLAHLQQVVRLKSLRHTVVSHAHPASVGSLAGALGGHITVLDYPPPVSKQKERDFAHSRVRRVAEGASLLDRSILNDRVFINALHNLVFPRKAPRRQQRQLRRSALSYLRRHLALWLGPLIEWRDEVERSGCNLSGELPADSLEYRLITQRQAQLPELIQPVVGRFHLELQQHPAGKHYAFHPALMVPIKSQLLWLLRQLANAEVPEAVADPDNCHYLHLAGLTVYDASALANPYLCGIPSLSAVAGFCHDYECRLGALLKYPVHFRGVAWYLSRYSRLTGKPLPAPGDPEKASVVSPIRRPGVLDDKKCDLGMDLVIEVQFSSAGPSSLANFVELLRAALPARFAGGCLHPPSLYEAKEWCTLHQDPAALFTLLSRLPRYGCWVYPASTKVVSIEELGEALAMEPRLRPVTTGFVFLEEPVERTGSLENKHVYAESAISTALCINPIEMRFAGKIRFYRNGFWRLSGENEAILMTGSARMG